jgi:hypothetical protein
MSKTAVMAARKGQALRPDERTPQPEPMFRVRYLALLGMRLPRSPQDTQDIQDIPVGQRDLKPPARSRA